MNWGILRRRLATALLGSALSGALLAQVNVSTYHNDAARTGQNTQETILTPANVNSNQFGKLFSVPLDGVVYAQPLYLSAININGGTHNVLYVATEHDSVYAVDADTGTIYAQVSLLPTGGSTVNSSTDLGCSDLVREVGITGTPVIDPASGTLYVVASSKVGSTFWQYLHALDVTTLQEKLNGPVAIQASATGTGYDATAGRIAFNAKRENQRPALLLDAGHVVISWSSHCDTDPYHGWVISYNATTLAQEATFNTSPNGNRNGVWMSGAGPAADGAGNIYFATGNGTWNGASDLGDSIVKLSPPGGGNFSVLDYFTPYDQSTLSRDDEDLGSGGLVVLPPLLSGQQLLAQQGKAGTIYLLDSSNLGKYCINLKPACSNNDPQVMQEIVDASTGIWGAPAYWNGNVYWAGTNDTIKAYSLNAGGSGLLSVSPISQTAQSFSYPGLTPAISSNGNANGILWGLRASPATLYAYDATNLGNLLYTSAQAADNRDAPGSTVKFVSPVVANGKVYFGTQNSVVAYGLLSASVSPAASPILSPAPGVYTSAQSVILTDSTPGAVIYYTTDGTTPSIHSAIFTAGTPLQIGTNITVQALAVASGYSNSAVSGGSYAINAQGIGSVSVNLSPVDNVVGIVADGSTVQNSGLDGDSYAYSATLLGTSISWAGSSFSLGGTGSLNAVTGATIALPPGNDTSVNLLATAVNGAQRNQTFIVTYTDGTTSSFTQSLSDWFAPQNFTGESQAVKMAYRIGPTGARQNGPWYLYGYSFAINSAKTVRSITLPKNRSVVVLAVDVSPTG
jgi:Chitobiase/beta-hexosaminidase C-terminal domain